MTENKQHKNQTPSNFTKQQEAQKMLADGFPVEVICKVLDMTPDKVLRGHFWRMTPALNALKIDQSQILITGKQR